MSQGIGVGVNGCPPPRSTRAGELADRLRRDIASGTFAGGERLTEGALAERYGTSRTPVREALRVLTQEMLLDHVPNWGHRVSRLRLSDLDDLYAVRLGVERQSVVRLADGVGDLGAVRELLHVWDVKPDAYRADVNLVFADEAFHESLAAASGGTVLQPALQLINRRLHSLRIREFIDEDRVRRTYEQHASILHAILDADPALASALMQSHILEGQRYVRRSALALGMVATAGEDLDDDAPASAAVTVGATPATVPGRGPAAPQSTLGIEELLAAYRSGEDAPRRVIAGILDAIACGDPSIWIDLVDENSLWARCEELDEVPDGPTRLPLYGLPFAVKDNIDVAGRPTTAGCPDFSRVARASARAVQCLERAGAILVGKTNLDQFATGLVGTRSPYGIPRNPSAPGHIPGGSSSGSAVAVASGLVSFGLGTDTAGSGRVPAAMTGIVGLKPTRGLVSTRGVVPACRSLDCVSVFAPSASAAAVVLGVLDEHDPCDVYNLLPGERTLRRPDDVVALRVGVPVLEDVEPLIAAAFRGHVQQLAGLGIQTVPIDLWPFEAAGRFLYDGPWLAERLASVGDFVSDHPDALMDITRRVIAGGRDYSAVDLFRAMDELAGLRRQANRVFAHVDVIALPSVPVLTTLAEVAADPVGTNARLGQFTNFVNLLDLAAVAVPAGSVDGVPVGFTLLGPALTDLTLASLAAAYLGDEPQRVPDVPEPVALAVAGAHLRGQPMHHQLVTGRARLLARTTTAPIYRLVALDGDGPAKPALVPSSDGVEVELEVYELPAASVDVLRAVTSEPLTISTVTLRDGSVVAGYRTVTDDLPAGRDISSFGSWRAYLASRGPSTTDEATPTQGDAHGRP